jgi:hypothetical protein
MSGKPEITPDEVYVLIRISNVRSKPVIKLMVDPWQMHVEGLLSLKADTNYEASFIGDPPAISLQDPLQSDLPHKRRSERGLARLVGYGKRKSTDHAALLAAAAEASSMYSYKSLNLGEIRLLRLSVGTRDMPIEGLVLHTSLDSAETYVALSYVWGPALRTFELATPNGNIPLTSSLHAALKRVRNENASILIWVDAVCIDQANDHEKVLQIRLMRQIFQTAESVIAWLGEENDNSSLAIQTLMQIRTLAIKPDVWPQNLPPIPSDWSGDVPDPTDPVWDHIQKFLCRGWFHRVWVVQEIVFASKVRLICGAWEVQWEDIFSAIELCRASRLLPEQMQNLRFKHVLQSARPAHTLGLTRRNFMDSRMSQRADLLSLIDVFAYTEATKEIDKLFALLGLASDADQSVFDPDYSSSLEAVVRRYAGEFVKRGKAMELLYCAGESKSYRFCSWIPNWTGKGPRETITTWCGAKGPFSAAGTTVPRAPIVHKGKLQLLGVQFDTVEELCNDSTNESDIISFVNTTQGFINMCTTYPTGESINDLKFKVPIGNAKVPYSSDESQHLEEDIDQDIPVDWAKEFSAIASPLEMISFMENPHHIRHRNWRYWTTAAAFSKRLSNGRFCITKKGYVGFVPYKAKLGDEICILQGGAVPFCMRRIPRTESEYKLIGESYIHGIMYGEAFSSVNTLKRSFVIV